MLSRPARAEPDSRTARFTSVASHPLATSLPEPSRTYMQYVNDRAVDKLGPILLPVADGLASHPAMAALSAIPTLLCFWPERRCSSC